MKVITNTPAPVTPPTYDLIGLTRAQMEVIAASVGMLRREDMQRSDLVLEGFASADSHHAAYDIYPALRAALLR